MASYLVDTNLLLRLSDTPSPQNPTAARALARLVQEGNEVFVTAQNLIEFWAVATRPREANGLGWNLERARSEMKAIRDRFPLLSESPAIFEEWIRLIEQFEITGKRTHDARLIAVLQANALDHLLTFNTADFKNILGISLVDPSLLAGPAEEE